MVPRGHAEPFVYGRWRGRTAYSKTGTAKWPAVTKPPALTLPILGDANTEQPRIGQEHVGRKRRVVRIEERAGDRRRVKHVLHIGHRLPAVLIGEDQGEVQVGITVQLVIRLVVEYPGEGIALPIEIAAQGAGPTFAERHGVLRSRREREGRRVGKLVATQIFREAFAVVWRFRRIEARYAERAEIGRKEFGKRRGRTRPVSNIAGQHQAIEDRGIGWRLRVLLDQLANDR